MYCALCAVHSQYTGKFVNMTSKTDAAEVYALSENGKWACGAHFASGDMNQAFYVWGSIWNTETGERIYLEEDPSIPCAIYWVNNDGTFAAGAHYNQPAYYTNGEWHTLKMPRGYSNAVGEVSAVGFNEQGDTIMIGWAYTAATRGTIIRWNWIMNLNIAILFASGKAKPKWNLHVGYQKMQKYILFRLIIVFFQ